MPPIHITLAKFMEGYEKELIRDVVVVKDKIYGRSYDGYGDEPDRYKVVYADLPP